MRRVLLWTVVVAVGLFAVVGLWTATTAPTRASVEETSRAVSQSLRCPTCAGESIADSSALLSDAMRQTVEEQVRQGRPPDEIRAWFAERYGDEVLLDPPRAGYGWLLWAAPVALVGAAAVVLLNRGASARQRLGAGVLALGVAALAGAWLFVPSASAPQPAPAQPAPAQAAPPQAAPPQAAPPQAAPPQPASPQAMPAPAEASESGPAAAGLDNAPDTQRAPGAPGAGDNAGAADAPDALDPSDTPGDPDASGAARADAVAVLRGAVEHNPGDAGLRIALAGALERTGEDAGAAQEYAAATRLRPLDPDTRYRHAFALVRSGDPAAGQQVLEESLQVEPDHAPSLLLLGALVRNLHGDRAEALLERFVRLEPDHPAAGQVREYLAGNGDALPAGVGP